MQLAGSRGRPGTATDLGGRAAGRPGVTPRIPQPQTLLAACRRPSCNRAARIVAAAQPDDSQEVSGAVAAPQGLGVGRRAVRASGHTAEGRAHAVPGWREIPCVIAGTAATPAGEGAVLLPGRQPAAPGAASLFGPVRRITGSAGEAGLPVSARHAAALHLAQRASVCGMYVTATEAAPQSTLNLAPTPPTHRPTAPPPLPMLQLVGDWRTFRAQLVAMERSSTGGVAEQLLTAPSTRWAHEISRPEKGCLLVARRKGLGMFSAAVILMLEHGGSPGRCLRAHGCIVFVARVRKKNSVYKRRPAARCMPCVCPAARMRFAAPSHTHKPPSNHHRCAGADDAVGSSGLVVNYPTPLLINNLGLEEEIAGGLLGLLT